MKKVIGVKFRPMKDVPLEERREILMELQVEKNIVVRERHGISANTITHIRFFHGSSSAKARGYYFKDLLEGVENPILEKVKELKKAGKNSGQVAQALNISLIKLNKIYEKA